MFTPSDITAPVFFTASQEQVLQTARKTLEDVTGMVTVHRTDGTAFTGSCFFFSNKMYVITCFHVIANAVDGGIALNFPAHGNTTFPATVVGIDEQKDLAMLVLTGREAETHNLNFIKISSESLRAHIVTFCGGYGVTGFHFSNGIMESSKIALRSVITNITDHGTSGGPCCGIYYNNLIGVVCRNFGSAHHRTELVPALLVLDFIQALHRQYPQQVPDAELV